MPSAGSIPGSNLGVALDGPGVRGHSYIVGVRGNQSTIEQGIRRPYYYRVARGIDFDDVKRHGRSDSEVSPLTHGEERHSLMLANDAAG